MPTTVIILLGLLLAAAPGLLKVEASWIQGLTTALGSRASYDIHTISVRSSQDDGPYNWIGGLMPIGFVAPYAGKAAPKFDSNVSPFKWLLCDGQAHKAAEYPELAKALGADRDGSHFNVPDYRTYFLRGAANITKAGEIEEASIESHTHSVHISDPGHTHDLANMMFNWQVPHNGNDQNVHVFSLAAPDIPAGAKPAKAGISASADSFGDKETRPKNMWVNYCIRAL